MAAPIGGGWAVAVLCLDWTAGNQRDACLRTVAVHPWLCKCGAPDRSGRARCGLLWPRAQQQEQCLAGASRTAASSTTAPCGSNSSVCSPQSRGPLIKSCSTTAFWVAFDRRTKPLGAKLAIRFCVSSISFLNPSAGVLPFLLAERNP
jgi:hypothetical protein